jgi:hypothetical protein
MKPIHEILLFGVLVPGLLFSLHGWSIPGGDSAEMAARLTEPWQFFLRAPLVAALNKTLWEILKPAGFSPGDCISLSSSIAGGLYLSGLLRISRDPRVWGVCLASKASFVFLGHVENYAWPFAVSIWCFHFLKNALEAKGASWPVWVTAGLGALFHPMVLMIWPGLAWALRPWNQRRVAEILISAVAVVLIYDAFLIFGNVSGFFQTAWITPLSRERLDARYTLFSGAHFLEIASFHMKTMSAGLFLLAAFGSRLRHGWKSGLWLSAVGTLAWSLVWYPGQGLNDWDLFAWPAILVNLAGGLAWTERPSTRARRQKPRTMKKPPQRTRRGGGSKV